MYQIFWTSNHQDVKGGNLGIQPISSSTGTIDLSTLAQARATSASLPATQKTGGTPPVGGEVKPAAPSAVTSPSPSLSSAKIYDKRDSNQDGAISNQEELLYSLKQSTTETQQQSSVSANQMQTGLSAYQNSQQANGTSISSPLFTI